MTLKVGVLLLVLFLKKKQYSTLIITDWSNIIEIARKLTIKEYTQQHNLTILLPGAAKATQPQCGKGDSKKEDHAGGFRSVHYSLPK